MCDPGLLCFCICEVEIINQPFRKTAGFSEITYKQFLPHRKHLITYSNLSSATNLLRNALSSDLMGSIVSLHHIRLNNLKDHTKSWKVLILFPLSHILPELVIESLVLRLSPPAYTHNLPSALRCGFCYQAGGQYDQAYHNH